MYRPDGSIYGYAATLEQAIAGADWRARNGSRLRVKVSIAGADG